MKRTKIFKLLKSDKPLENILIKGWVRTCRNSAEFSFIEVNDGSCLENMQILADDNLSNYNQVKKISTGSAVAVKGNLIKSRGKGQVWEIHSKEFEILSLAPEDYPLQKKRHTDEFLRTVSHLRPRTNKYSAAFRIRSDISWAIHKFFRQRGFKYIHTPIITGSDCEGAGQLFNVTTSDPPNPDKQNHKTGNPSEFFGKPAYLTVSGQLSAEMFALALGDVYTFGPTFRAENSNTRRHAAEFWMIEPEMAFCDLSGNMDIAEQLIKYLTEFVMDQCADDIGLFGKFVDKNLMPRLENIISHDFIRITYTEAVSILEKSGKKFQYSISFGKDLQTEHEKYLTEQHFKKPVIVYNYPLSIKPFYMRVNNDGETVAAMDVLMPGIGEIIGGSQREERLEILESRIENAGLSKRDYWWYLDSRRFGTVEHSGFGLGFERVLMLLTGINNIRDIIPFPRTPGAIEF
jgi:asparaginyl-tRNA synthetase